jgi:hypothetical protein
VFLKNLIVQYLQEGIAVHNSGHVEIEGSIIGDCFFTAVNVYTVAAPNDELVFTNTIFKSVGGPAIVTIPGEFSGAVVNKNYLPKITVNGFMDIYNWMRPEELKNLISRLDAGMFGDLSSVNGFNIDNLLSYLGDFMVRIFNRPETRHMFYKDPKTGDDYINFGAFIIGLYSAPNKNLLSLNDSSLELLSLTLPVKEATMSNEQDLYIFNLAIQFAVVAMGIKDKGTLGNTSYVVTYDMNGKTPKNKPGDPIPQNEETFNKLTGVYSLLKTKK